MSRPIDYARLAQILRGAAEKVRQNRAYLSELDSATGDGDHGTAMSKVAGAILDTISGHPGSDIKQFLSDLGWAVMSTDAGSTSPLYGSFFLGMGEAVPSGTMVESDFVAMLERGVAKLRQNTKAEVGAKTMIDALIPAMTAIRTSWDTKQDLRSALVDGATAAVAGAESTKAMKATFGRARNLGERSIGHIDPGAASMSLLFVGMKEGYVNA